MNEPWYYSRDRVRAGPVSGSELKRMAMSGELSPMDMVWKQGMTNWVPAGKTKGLFKSELVVPPPLPPPDALVEARPAEPATSLNAKPMESDSVPIAGVGHVWFYLDNGQTVGPSTEESLKGLLTFGQLPRTTLVWCKGMPNWCAASETSLIGGTGTSSSNPWIWILSFAPIFQEIITFVFGIPFTLKATFYFYAILNGSMATLDEKHLKKTGHATEKLNKWWGLILVPVYLYQRGKYVQRQNYTFLIIWCVVFVVSAGLSTIPAFNLEHGHYLAMGKLDVWYKPPVTEWQATKVGQMLVKNVFGETDKASVQILNESDRFQLRIVTKDGTEDDSQVQAGMQLLVLQLQLCLGSKNVEIHMCDGYLKTKKVFKAP